MNMKFFKMPRESEKLEDDFMLSILGERELSLIPCRRVLLYEEDAIRIETVGCVVSVKGEGLSLKAYHGKEMRISGRLDAVSIERG